MTDYEGRIRDYEELSRGVGGREARGLALRQPHSPRLVRPGGISRISVRDFVPMIDLGAISLLACHPSLQVPVPPFSGARDATAGHIPTRNVDLALGFNCDAACFSLDWHILRSISG